MSRFFQAKAFFNYWLDAVNEHSLHSPFLFDLYTKTINQKPQPDARIEHLRAELLKTHREIAVTDLGAPSKHFAHNKRKISDIARTSASSIRFSALYERLVRYTDAKTIIELGTSFGLNTLYLAKKTDARIYTFEGLESVAEVAESTFAFAGAQNIELVKGNINQTLTPALARIPKVDFAFLDANHQYAPTLDYVNRLLPGLHAKSIVVIDDIHGHAGMQQAWDELRQHPLVYTSIDLYRCGILFFDPSLTKQHVVLLFTMLD